MVCLTCFRLASMYFKIFRSDTLLSFFIVSITTGIFTRLPLEPLFIFLRKAMKLPLLFSQSLHNKKLTYKPLKQVMRHSEVMYFYIFFIILCTESLKYDLITMDSCVCRNATRKLRMFHCRRVILAIFLAHQNSFIYSARYVVQRVILQRRHSEGC